MKNGKKRVLILSDLHTGHKSGLWKGSKEYDLFIKEVNKLKPIDICVVNGDAIDGKGERSGGTELITSDRLEQANMAIKVLEEIEAKVYRFTYGTAYHTGQDEDFEWVIAEHFGAKIRGHDFFDVNGLVFDVKHKISKSTIPHGRYAPLARQKVWNLFWNEFDEVPKAHIFVRSHVHYFAYCGGRNWLALITPALQGWGSKYGERQCENTIDWGFVYFDVKDQDTWTWHPLVYKTNKVNAPKL